MCSYRIFTKSYRGWALLLPVILVLSVAASAQTPHLVLRVGDVLAPAGAEGIPIPVYMENYYDTVAAFQFWLILSNPDVFQFQNTPLKASQVSIDTSGTLISGWEFVEARSLMGTGIDADIVAQANTYLPPYTPGIGYPQYGDIPLIKVLSDTYELSENPITVTAGIMIQTGLLDKFGFSDENGSSIGILTDTSIDTTCWNCVQWEDPPDNTICLQWELVAGTNGDSCAYDTSYFYSLDTTEVKVYDGSLTAFLCGDVNGDYKVNIFDITDMIGIIYLFVEHPEHWSTIGDVNNDEAVNIFDVTTLISFLYMSGPPPSCPYEWLP
jgi:hypothetical protein